MDLTFRSTGRQISEYPMSQKTFSIRNLKLDPKAEAEGVWFDVGGGLRLRIARISSPPFENWMRKNTRIAATKKLIAIDEDLETQIRPGVAKFILLGWENLTDEKDQPIPYSEQMALKLLTEYREFFRLVMGYAQEYEGYRVSDQQEAEGNS